MKAFDFRLEKVLKLREHAENNAKLELGAAVSALGAIENSLLQNAAERSAAAAERFASGVENARLADARRLDAYVTRLDSEKTRLTAEREAAARAVDAARAVFAEASRDKKVIEKLREKAWAEYRRQREDAEEKEARGE